MAASEPAAAWAAVAAWAAAEASAAAEAWAAAAAWGPPSAPAEASAAAAAARAPSRRSVLSSQARRRRWSVCAPLSPGDHLPEGDLLQTGVLKRRSEERVQPAERVVDLGGGDDQRRQEAQRARAGGVDHEALLEQRAAGELRRVGVDVGRHHQASGADRGHPRQLAQALGEALALLAHR